jgi:hypothetical protein
MAVIPAAAHTPLVRIVNTSHPASIEFQVGDSGFDHRRTQPAGMPGGWGMAASTGGHTLLTCDTAFERQMADWSLEAQLDTNHRMSTRWESSRS